MLTHGVLTLPRWLFEHAMEYVEGVVLRDVLLDVLRDVRRDVLS